MNLSVVIINWNSVTFLKKCLTSIYANTTGIEFEILVVDNASSDGCEKIIRREFPKVRFIQSGANVGFARANNHGFGYARGDYILFLNPDTEIVGSAISVMFSFLKSTPDAGLIGAKLLNSDLSVQTSCIQRFPTILNQVLDAEYLSLMFPNAGLWGTKPLFESENGFVEVDVISGACLMVKRPVFQGVGQFSADYFMYTEDVDLCYKIKQAGWKIYYVGDATVIHHGGGSTCSKAQNAFAAVMMRESRMRFMTARRGKLYAAAYRTTTALAAICRLFLLGTVLLLTIDRVRRNSLRLAFTKWSKILRWTVGMEDWVKRAAQPERGRAETVSERQTRPAQEN